MLAASEDEAFRMLVLAVFTLVPTVARVAPSEVLAFPTAVLTLARVEPRLDDALLVLLLIEVTAPET
jgi:hypothetical protein